ncbi:hypothetical protein N9W21_00350 [Shewanella sp.]|nr:hypothetical protein [Shewanella sp.]
MGSTIHSDALPLADKSLAHMLYGLMACFPILLLPALLSLFINLNQPLHSLNAVLASHLKWQRWSTLGMLLIVTAAYLNSHVWVSTGLYIVGIIWFSSRIVKGWVNLIEDRRI